MILRLTDVSLAYGARPLLDRVGLQVAAGERVCLVGRNGEGKSSLLRVARGEIAPDAGVVWSRPGARIAWLVQDLGTPGDAPVAELVRGGLGAGGVLESWQAEQRVVETLARLGLDGAAHFSALSGGWQRRALLARALVSDPELLLLDEPTNHLDIGAIEWLEEALHEYRGALLFVSHDRRFVNRLATRVVELDRGRLFATAGNYEVYLQKKAQLLAAEAQQAALFDKKLAQEEAWIRKGVEARRTRNEGRVRALLALREQHRQRRERTGRVHMEQHTAGESGKLVFEAEGASAGYGARTVIRGLTTRILRGDRIGIVGANGAGKSTLLRLLLGEIEASAGSVRRGTRLEVAYYDQQREQLDLDASVAENVAARNDHVVINGQSRHVATYLRDFLFRPEQLRTPARALSGGERNRLLLARLFTRPANLLVLDEPTNDLDMDTLELLEEYCAEFDGTLLLVSHDRAFLDNVVTDLLVIDGAGQVQDFVGGYGDWERYREAQAEASRGEAARTGGGGARGAVGGTAAAPAESPPLTARPRKLSYKEQRELEALPARIEALEAEQQALQASAGDPAFYARPHAEVQAQLARLAVLGGEIEAAYARWESLGG